ncbi:Uncharacterised protein [Vibrio cholerae]|nr:Uncharacterised protein [Vibrio cholerae]
MKSGNKPLRNKGSLLSWWSLWWCELPRRSNAQSSASK